MKVLAEKTFRGRKYPKLVEICSASYKADYRLIPKDQEAEYCMNKLPVKEETILPQTMDFPPLLKAFIVDETGIAEPKMRLVIKKSRDKNCRIAEDSETANTMVELGIGKPASPSLYG